jgi:transposase
MKDKDYLKENLGIDVSKDELKVCLSGMKKTFEIDVQSEQVYTNEEKGWKSMKKWLKSRSINLENLYCTMEATGVYHEGIAHYLHDEGCIVSVVLANQAKSYRMSFGLKSKTDKVDAKVLSKMGLERNLQEWNPPSSSLIQLKQITRERTRIVKALTVIKNEKHSYLHQAEPNATTIERANSTIKHLKAQVKEIDKEIETLMQEDEEMKRKLPYAKSIPGVSTLTVAISVAETRGFEDTYNLKQLVSYSGLDVQIMESGTWQGEAHISKKGNRYIRQALYMPTLTKIRCDANTKARYEKLKGKTCSMKAITAESRKLLCLIYVLWNKEEMYDPDYNKNNNKSVNTKQTDIPSVSVEEQKNDSKNIAVTVVEKTVSCADKSDKTTVSRANKSDKATVSRANRSDKTTMSCADKSDKTTVSYADKSDKTTVSRADKSDKTTVFKDVPFVSQKRE